MYSTQRSSQVTYEGLMTHEPQTLNGRHLCRMAEAMMGLSDMDKMVSEAVLSEQAKKGDGHWGIQKGDNTLTGTSKIIRNPSIENESTFLKSYRIVENHPIHPIGMQYMVIPSSSPSQGSKSSRRSPGSSGSHLELSPSLFHPFSPLMGSYLFPLKMVTFHSYVKLPEGTWSY